MTAAQAKPLYQIMPEMTSEQYAALKEDIRRHGVLQPVEFDEQGRIVDGHHRVQAFTELISEGHDIPMYPKVTRKYPDEDSKLEHIISFNVERRQLTPGQRLELVVTLRARGWPLQRIASTLKLNTTTVWRDIKGLPDDERKALESIVVEGRDGRVYTPTAPRISIQTGMAQLREMQTNLINEASARMKAEAALAPVIAVTSANPTQLVSFNGATPTPQPVTSAPPPAAPTIGDDEAARRLSAFSWYGGKSSHLAWLLPLLPQTTHFVDVFGGSGAVIMNREPSPIETYNDLDSGVVTFFRVLRNHTADLLRAIALTPYSREERRIAYETLDALKKSAGSSDLEKARLFFVLAKQTRSGLAQSRHSLLNSWRFTRDRISQGVAVYVQQWDDALDGLAAVAARFRTIQIENYSWDDVIDLYDTPDTLFYCDPPYVHESRSSGHIKDEYAFEMTDDDHRRFAAKLHRIKGKAAVSGYPSSLYDEIFGDWQCVKMPVSSSAGTRQGSGGAGERIECLWANYRLL